VHQRVIIVDCKRKTALLGELIKKHGWEQVLVFTRTKHHANKVSDYLNKIGIPSSAIHGNKSQGARTKALADFKAGSIKVLAATDIAARGLDIDQLPHVINLELPNISEDYVHRIGRTGRAGNNGEAISLVCVDEFEYLKNIEKLIKRTLEREVIEGFEPDLSIKPEPIQQGRGQRPQGQPKRRDNAPREYIEKQRDKRR